MSITIQLKQTPDPAEGYKFELPSNRTNGFTINKENGSIEINEADLRMNGYAKLDDTLYVKAENKSDRQNIDAQYTIYVKPKFKYYLASTTEIRFNLRPPIKYRPDWNFKLLEPAANGKISVDLETGQLTVFDDTFNQSVKVRATLPQEIDNRKNIDFN